MVRAADGREWMVGWPEWRAAVFAFADRVSEFYAACSSKQPSEDDAAGFKKFQVEWERRRGAALGTMILRILEAEVRGPYRLELSFNDGVRAVVDVEPLLSGPVFEPLREPGYFARVVLDPICGTVVWPNGADFAPEALHPFVSRECPASAESTASLTL